MTIILRKPKKPGPTEDPYNGKRNFKVKPLTAQLETEEDGWRVFSSNPDKRWAEIWYLCYSPIWPLIFMGWCKSGYYLQVGDLGNIIVTILIASPNIFVPYFFCPTNTTDKSPISETYWFKFSIWLGIFSFVASYFFSEYFFDVLGMVYNFSNLNWKLDSTLVGSGRQVVPIMMYIHAWYFFITYHTCSIIFIRTIKTSKFARTIPFSWSITVIFTAWLFSVGEIYATTMDQIKDVFHYKNMEWALHRGAWGYSCYFISSFPMVYWLDEEKGHPKWSISKTVENSLAASMASFILLDIVCQYIITGWRELNF